MAMLTRDTLAERHPKYGPELLTGLGWLPSRLLERWRSLPWSEPTRSIRRPTRKGPMTEAPGVRVIIRTGQDLVGLQPFRLAVR